MAYTTSNLALRVWDSGSDAYDHGELAANWQSVDVHDHSGAGKGVKISSNGIVNNAIQTGHIQDGSVTNPKLAANSVTTDKIADNAITSAKIADGTITGADIANGSIDASKLNGSVVPVGTVISWYRPNGSVPIPTGWEICDGRAWASVPNAWGVNTGNMPDLRNKFILGAATSGTGSGTSTPPAIGASGGLHVINLEHAHLVDAHTHTVPAQTVASNSAGSHRHKWLADTYDSNGNVVSTEAVEVEVHQRGTAVPGSQGVRQSLYIIDRNRNQVLGEDVVAHMANAGAHTHTVTVNSINSAAASPSTSIELSATADKRPAFVGLLYLMRVL